MLITLWRLQDQLLYLTYQKFEILVLRRSNWRRYLEKSASPTLPHWCALQFASKTKQRSIDNSNSNKSFEIKLKELNELISETIS